METKNVCVYFLRDPRDMKPRYVGISEKPSVRMRQHIAWACKRYTGFQYSKPGTEERYVWFNDLFKDESAPLMDVVFTGLTTRQARSVEAYLLEKHIDTFYQANSGRIDNVGAFNRLWQKCGDRERKIIQRIIERSMVAS
jgi:predicted GIY-YIG superfamily endonuclease